ncbi:TPA: hypothetical protein ACH3X1_005309 [Trebouxia sp. C0004]
MGGWVEAIQVEKEEGEVEGVMEGWVAVGEEGDLEVRGAVGMVSWEGVVMQGVEMEVGEVGKVEVEVGEVGKVEEEVEGLVGVKKGVGWGVMGAEKVVSLKGVEMEKVGAGKVGVVGVEKDLVGVEKDSVGVVKAEMEVVVEVVRGIGHRFSDNWPWGMIRNVDLTVALRWVDIGIFDPAAGDAGEANGLTGDAMPPVPGAKGSELPGEFPEDNAGVEPGVEDGVVVEDDPEGDSGDDSGNCSGDASALGMGGSGSGERVLGLPGARDVLGAETGRLFGGDLAATGDAGVLGEVVIGELAVLGEAVVEEVGGVGAVPDIGEALGTVGELPVVGVSSAGVGKLTAVGEPEELNVGTMALPGGACGDWLAVGEGLATAAGMLLTGGEMTGLTDTGEMLVTVVPAGREGEVTAGVAGGVADGAAGGVAGVAGGVADGLAGGVPGGVAGGIAGGVADGVTGGVAGGVAGGLTGGGAGGLTGGVVPVVVVGLPVLSPPPGHLPQVIWQ